MWWPIGHDMGHHPEVREPFHVGCDRLRLPADCPCLPHEQGCRKGGVLGDLAGVGIDPEDPGELFGGTCPAGYSSRGWGGIETPSSVRHRTAGPPFGPGMR